ncbi:MAG TPA: intein-containing Rv2578c family radical SAM protein [Streptosporangiaceae bacterium]
MRWDAMRITDGGPAAPALFERNAVARTFDTPGFRGMTFFEVQARSVINRVPEASRMPFRWTINPYRGCSHACVYCVSGETPILMADGRTRPIADLEAGDAIYGTVRRGRYRRYTRTTVLAHWQTVKPAYLITLEDGTSLVTSGDHRFLSDRGWKYVTGQEQGALRRPHLTTGNKLMGVGGFADQPKDSAAYQRGYLCGMVRGDGTLGTYAYPYGQIHSFRLALADTDALTRARDYLTGMGVTTSLFTFAEATESRRKVMAIRTAARDQVRFIEWLTHWPTSPGPDWRKGFLAGIFDAEGSYSRGILRISNTDPAIIGWTIAHLYALGFAVVVEPARHTNGLRVIRLRGGLREALRFFHTTDPAITRKRTIEDVAIKSDARLGVVSVQPLGLDVPMFDITTGTGDFIADGVVSHNCYARQSHTYLDLDAGHDFDSKIVVKVNAPERVRAELAAPRWQGEHIAMGTNVDCYQRAEGRYRLMPGILAALRDAANPFSILTKGTLILRDIDLLAEAAEVTEVGLAVSVGCTDEDLWRLLEPGTPSPRRRLDVCAAFTARGLGCAVLMGPVVPYLSDSPGQLAATVRQIAAAGATSVSPIVLHLRPGAREWFLRWLGEHHPDLLPRYRALYGRGAYAPKAYQQQVTEQVRALARQYRIGQHAAGHRAASRGRPPRARFGGAPAGPGTRTGAAPVQLTLL